MQASISAVNKERFHALLMRGGFLHMHIVGKMWNLGYDGQVRKLLLGKEVHGKFSAIVVSKVQDMYVG